MSKKWNTVNIQYDKKNNIIVLPIKSDEVLPAFLHYLLEFNNLPQNATMKFLDQTVKLEKTDQDYIYRRV